MHLLHNYMCYIVMDTVRFVESQTDQPIVFSSFFWKGLTIISGKCFYQRKKLIFEDLCILRVKEKYLNFAFK